MKRYNTLFYLTSFVIVLILFLDQPLGSKLKDTNDPLTPDENVEFLNELINCKKGNGDLLIPKSSKAQEILQLKLKKLKTWVNAECDSFLVNPFATSHYQEVFDCYDEFYGGMELTADKFCDHKTQNEFLKCVLSPIQTYAYKLFRCYTTTDPEFKWDKPVKTMLSIQHGVLKTIPNFLNMIMENLCTNQEIISGSIRMKDELTKLVAEWQHENEKSEGKFLMGMGVCWLTKNDIKKGSTLCEHYSKFDYKSIVDCFLEMKQFESIPSQLFWKMIVMGFDNMTKKIEGNSPQSMLQDTLWKEFCVEESPLFFLFNERPVRDDAKKDEL